MFLAHLGISELYYPCGVKYCTFICCFAKIVLFLQQMGKILHYGMGYHKG